MADCKACGGWFSSTAPSELCPTCKRALKRLNGYAVPVVRCENCKHYGTSGCAMDTYAFDVVEEGFCSYGERRKGK